MEKTMKRYGVNHLFSTSYHPQTSGQVKNTNMALKRILEKTVKDNHAIWSRKLDDALGPFRTAYKTPTGTTPYKLIYGKNCHLPFEIEHRAYWALKNCNPDLIAAGEKRMFQLHELDELRYQAYENSRLYKERTKVWHDRKLRIRKEFKQGNKVLLFHSKYKFKQPKLKSRWLGPYVVKHQYPSGYVKLYGKDGNTFIALKNYNPNLIAVGEKRMFQLHELDELRYQAYENSLLYKERTKVTYEDLTDKEKIYEECDIRATNIVLQDLPPDVYTLVNHHTKAKEIWDRVKLLIEGTELSLQERMTMQKLKVNSKFVNNLQPEWSKFVTSVKLARDMHESNFDKLYAYLRQHEDHANESQYHQQLSPVAQQFYSPPPSQDTYEALTPPQSYEPQVNITWLGSALNQSGQRILNGLKRKDAFDSDCDEAPSASAVLIAKLSAYDSDVLSEVPNLNTYQTNVFDQGVQEMQYSEQPPFSTDSDIDITIEMIKSVIEEMSNQVAQCNAVNQENKTINKSLTAELERYKEQIKNFEERQKFDLTDREKCIDGQMRGVIVDRNAKFDSYQKAIQTLKLQLSANIENNKVLNNQMDVLKKEFSEKQDKHIKEIVDLEK
ncbi:reverse transcriptase domain-containing protein [Tanacetum coccineum]